MVDRIRQNHQTLINPSLLKRNPTQGNLHKKQITPQSNRNHLQHRKSLNHINEINPINIAIVKWCPTRPFRKDEVTTQVKKARCGKIEKSIQ